jgi:predicted NBD/HSP70 family sugar kinase
MVFAAIEGGGTTWVAALVSENQIDNFIERHSFETTTPAETLGAIRQWLNDRKQDLHAIGIASFGPVDAKKDSPTFGYITSTPKPNWSNTNVIGLLGLNDDFLGIPFDFDTDVNAPAMAEFQLKHKAR